MKVLGNWMLNALIILVAAYILPGVMVEGFFIALLVALVLGILNAVVRPIFIILTLPITIVTFGLFLLVINSVLVYFTSWLVSGFSVANFWWALLFGVVLSILNFVVNSLYAKERDPRIRE